MKNKVLTLIIGILIGSILTSGVFLIVKPNSKNNQPDFSKMPTDFSGMKDGERPSFGDSSNRPSRKERPSSDSENKTEDNKTEEKSE